MAFSAANTVRYDNMVQYSTPSFSGVQFGIGYSFNAADTTAAQTGFRTADNTRAITTGLRYVSGPLNLAVTYDQLNPASQLNTDATPKAWMVGGSYDFEVVKLALAYGQTRDGWFTGQGANAFGSGSASLTAQAQASLRTLAGQLRGGAGKVSIEGHTDSQGADAANMALSQRRAEAVRRALEDAGLPSARLSAGGRGETVPVADNTTAEGRARNRRVEIIVN